MQNTIDNYYEGPMKNGLLLIDMPTGFGKTYLVLNFIFDQVMKAKNKKQKFFFITTLKKNLPVKELKERFVKNGKQRDFKEKVLLLDSNMESAINGLTEEVLNAIPNEITKLEVFKAFAQEVEEIKRLRNQSGSEYKTIKKNVEDNFRTSTEPAFRKMIERMLRDKYKTADERLYAIKTDINWKWLGKLYPSVFIHEKQIVFMSIAKFMARNSPIIEPSELFYNSDLFDNAIVFIDEFDSAKETMLNNIIATGLKDRIDYIDFFKVVHAALKTNDFPGKLITPSKRSEEDPQKYPSLQKVIDNMTKKADELFDKYFLNFSHKTTAAQGARNFLFQDFDYVSVLDGNKSFISVSNDMPNRINTIAFTEEKVKAEYSNIHVMLGELRGFINYFRGGVSILAENYLQCKREMGDQEFTREFAIMSALEEFHLNRNYIEYIVSQIMTKSYKSLTKSAKERQDLSFYNNGYRFYSFEDNATHDMHSKIMYCNFTRTPEMILLKLCERAKVIGISATATMPTVLGNFDIGYIKSKLRENFVVPTEEEKQRMKLAFQNSITGYSDVNINVDLIGNLQPEYSVKTWMQVFENHEFAEKSYQTLERILTKDKRNAYLKERYFRIVMAFKKFIEHDDIQSFLCILTKHPRRCDNLLDLNILIKMFKDVSLDLNLEINPANCVYQLDGNEYDAVKDEIMERLAKGEKLFVISVYQTIGAGQNLQYPVPKYLIPKMNKINEMPERGEKDFDAIYLDKPTNLLVNLENENVGDGFAKYIYHALYLQENYELSRAETKVHIRKAFRNFAQSEADERTWTGNIYQSPSVQAFATKVLIQAVGRICRTNLKQDNIYVYADSRIIDCMSPGLDKNRLLNPEFAALYDRVIYDVPVITDREKELKNKAALVSDRTNRHIESFLVSSWIEEKVDEWKELRENALKYPTMPEEMVKEDFTRECFYVELFEPGNKLYYQQEEDYKKVTVSFMKDKATPLEVSAEAAKLDQLMSVPFIEKHFTANGYATDFEASDYILSPTYFNNIYKGALGEEVGKLLFSKVLGVELIEIEELMHYELFDFKVKDKPVYVDFKNWHESTTFDDAAMLRKIVSKARACDCKCAIIANILAEKGYKVTHKTIDDITVIEIPALMTGEKDYIRFYDPAWDKIRRVINEYSN